MKDQPPSITKQLAPFLAGLCGGAASTILLYPLDLVKVRMQVNVGEITGNKTVKGTSKRLTSLQAFRTVIKHEGFMGLYQGLTPAVIGSAISWGGYFYVYEGLKRAYSTHNHPQQPRHFNFTAPEHFLLSCTAGAIMVAITNPVWLIKTRIQLQMTQTAVELGMKRPYANMLDAAKTIIKEEGALALYKGAGPALMLTSHGGVQFMCYEYLRKHFHYSRPKRDPSTQISVIERLHLSIGYLSMGAISKIVASTVTYPLQVLKSRLQQRSESIELTSSGDVRVVKRNYVGAIQTVKNIVSKEGFSAFFKGCIPNALRVAPGAAITFVVYETIVDVVDDQ